MKRANAGTLRTSPVVASLMAISSRLLSPVTPATAVRGDTVIFSCESICETRYWEIVRASEGPLMSMVTELAYRERYIAA